MAVLHVIWDSQLLITCLYYHTLWHKMYVLIYDSIRTFPLSLKEIILYSRFAISEI